MSHNLALVRGCAVRPHWLEQNLGIFPGRNQVAVADAMNVLVVPWPFEVNCRNFAPIHDEKVSKLPPDHRFFGFMPPTGGIELVSRISKLLDMARTRYGRVDGIILPELAIRQDDFDLLRDAVIDDVGFVICGIAQSATEEGHGANYATICIGAGDGYSEIKQYKHHRWYLEDSQIRRYGLSSVLDPGKFWWESATLRNRELTFLALEPWLTMSVLICEDLARPDPVGEIVRAVGPNLVVALLLDGPQIAGRWSERSAAVLADDPGCSVLTLTCLGMSVLSRSPDGKPPMRVIGLWKDREGLQKIELPEGNEAVLLSLSSRYGEEWTADGRGDDKHSANIRLTGIYAIPSPK